jgi:hypothetical protein
MEIAAFQIDSFLNEKGYCFDPDNKKLESTKYSKKGMPPIYVPTKDTFTTPEIISMFTSVDLYNQLIKFTNNNYWK